MKPEILHLAIHRPQSDTPRPRSAVWSRRTTTLAAATLALLFVSIYRITGQGPAPPALTLLAKDGRRSLAITVANGQELVSLDELAGVFQLAVREESFGALTVSYKGKTIVLTPDQALASVAGRLISLPAPPVRAGRRWLVPVDFIGRALVLIYDTRLDLRKPSHLLVLGELRVPRVTIRYDPSPGGARLTIDTAPHASTSVGAEGNDHLTIKFDADALDLPTPLFPSQSPQGLVQGIQVTDGTTLTVDLGSRVVGFRATTQVVDAVERLIVDLRAPQAEAPSAQVTPPPAPAPTTTQAPPQVGAPLVSPVRGLTTIVIDAGHGGEDRGVTGSNGLREKDVALAVALQLKAAIEGRLGTRVLLTREDDRQLSIDNRTAFANNNKADLFISLHADASFRPVTTGGSIYCASFDSDVEAADPPARPDRAPVVGGGVRDIELVAWNRAQTRHLARSLSFAELLAQRLHDRVPLESRAIKRAPLTLLESANMPAVLIEMGFLSNPDQERQLATGDFQAAFVQAVTDAIVGFRDTPSTGSAR